MHKLNEFLTYTAQHFGELEAYVWGEGDKLVSKTYADLRDDAARTAAWITERFGTRQKMALIGDTSYAWINIYYGVMCSANITVPTDVKLSPEQIAHQLDSADVSVVFLSQKYAVLKDFILQNCRQVEAVFTLEEFPETLPAATAPFWCGKK